MEGRHTMDWKAFTIRLIEVLRWPLALVAIFFFLRGAVGKFIVAVASMLSN